MQKLSPVRFLISFFLPFCVKNTYSQLYIHVICDIIKKKKQQQRGKGMLPRNRCGDEFQHQLELQQQQSFFYPYVSPHVAVSHYVSYRKLFSTHTPTHAEFRLQRSRSPLHQIYFHTFFHFVFCYMVHLAMTPCMKLSFSSFSQLLDFQRI